MHKEIFKDTRCDRCFNKHLRCNRAFPICNQCALVDGSACSYKRKFQRRRRDDGSYTHQVGIIDLRKKKEELRLKKITILSPLVVVLRSPFRSLINSAMTSLNYPCPQSAPKSIEFLISNIFQQGGASFSVPSIYPRAHSRKVLFMLLRKAQQAFFENVNPMLALFPKGDFEGLPRSPLLRAAILACGLYWCRGDPLLEETQAQLTKYLIANTIPSKLSFSLDSLQALLVITVGLFGAPWMGRRIDKLQSISICIANAIGLHVLRKKNRVELERRLASNCFLYHINFMSLGGLHISLSFPPLSFNTTPCTISLFASSMAHFNCIFPELLKLKIRLVECKDRDLESVEAHVSDLKTKLDRTCLRFLAKLHRFFGPRINQEPLLLNMFSFYHSYYSFFISGMRLYRSTNTLSPIQQGPPCQQSLNTALYHCSRALQWGMKSLSYHFHWHNLAKFGQCLIFFALHRDTLSKTDYHILLQGIEHLKRQTENPHSGAVFYYIQFIHKLDIFFPQNALVPP